MSKKASIIFGVVIAVILGLWLWTAFIPKDYISIGGSTSVDPVMQRLTNKYSTDEPNKGNFVYSSSGSRGGLSNTESGIYQMGFISRTIDEELSKKVVQNEDNTPVNPPTGFDPANSLDANSKALYSYFIDNQKYGDQFNYFQMGTDAIVLTYNPTADFAKNYADKFVIDPTNGEHQKIIHDIYDRNLNWITLAQRLTGETYEQVSAKLTNPKNKDSILPFARETGSGTRNSFEQLFSFQKTNPPVPSKAIESNSNGIMYTGIEATINSFGYLSLNYLRSIHSTPHLKTVIIQSGTNQFNPLDDANFENGDILLEKFKDYPLTRPYIGLFKANLSKSILEQIAGFLAWTSEALKTDVQTSARKIYQIEGLIPEMRFNFALS